MKEIDSKVIEGISDLVVIAPIKNDFIQAFETITYASRLEIVANALNRMRVAAREYERVTPYSDVTERILSLLDFRVGVIDEDLFALVPEKNGARTQVPRRYLYLTATFDGGFEPYMRQIWRPLGPFLDLLFCNCEGYITATDHSFEEYIQWVRDNQVDSSIFYSTTGITVRDQRYLSNLEKLLRSGDENLLAYEIKLASYTMVFPEDESEQIRKLHFTKAVQLGFEALNVLYKLVDYYPPDWLTGPAGEPQPSGDGLRLLRATDELLKGWREVLAEVRKLAPKPGFEALAAALVTYADPLNWYETGLREISSKTLPPDPHFDQEEVQSGILRPHGSRERPISSGALMLFTVRDAEAARRFIGGLVSRGVIDFGDKNSEAGSTKTFVNIAFSSIGMLELGMPHSEHDCLPREFREGLSKRASQVGDLRENHPRNWELPERNGPCFLGGRPPAHGLPPVALEEVDFVLQLRGFDAKAVRAQALELGLEARPGASLEAIEWLHVKSDDGRFTDHFGFLDGISQPKPILPKARASGLVRDRVALGEVLLGYGNDRGDGPPALFGTLDKAQEPHLPSTAWRNYPRTRALDLMKNGSFMVIRKIGQDVDRFETWLNQEKVGVARQLGCSEDQAKALVKSALMGRRADGSPLVPQIPADANDFDFRDDAGGVHCPHNAHIRRANPRRWDPDSKAPTAARQEFDRPTPRLLRRGMLFGNEKGPRGVMFMAHAASLSEQYEVIQRWLNGGNPTDVASANNDVLTGVRPKGDPGTLRFIARDCKGSEVVVRVQLPGPTGDGAEPGKHPFTPLYWGLYLFTPSRSALAIMTGGAGEDLTEAPDYGDDPKSGWTGGYRPLREMKELSVGKAQLDRLAALPRPQAAREWKRMIEDFLTKDPSERDISPHLSSAIRWYYGGAFDLQMPLPPQKLTPAERKAWKVFWGHLPEYFMDGSSQSGSNAIYKWENPDTAEQNVILCAGETQILQVLSDWRNFTSQEQLRRIHDKTGPIYVTQQPDNKYISDDLLKSKNLNYHEESKDTNDILFQYSESDAFINGYEAGAAVLDEMKRKSGRTRSFKLELRRQFIQPAIAELWKKWYGLPDDEVMLAGAWDWKRLSDRVADPTTERDKAVCPGDFLAPSRGAVYPRPNRSIKHFAKAQGDALNRAGLAFVDKLNGDPSLPRTQLIGALFNAYPGACQREILARNIIGTMIGAIPPMDANLRNILLEWLLEQRLWRHQAAFKAALNGGTVRDNVSAALAMLKGPVTQAMCKRPAPDLLFRTAKGKTTIRTNRETRKGRPPVVTKEGDLVIVNLASASQRRLSKRPHGDPDDVSIIFGGTRNKPLQGYSYDENGVTWKDDGAVHACPAQKMAMGGMMGVLAALLDAGTLQALPASLIIRISDW